MKYSEGSLGRVFVLRLEDGDPLNTTVEAFAREHGVERGVAFYVGGGAGGTSLVVGPDATRDRRDRSRSSTPSAPPHETFAVGTLFPDEAGEPYLHMHAACGREGDATVGCTRAGLETWLIGEIVLVEITGSKGSRRQRPGHRVRAAGAAVAAPDDLRDQRQPSAGHREDERQHDHRDAQRRAAAVGASAGSRRWRAASPPQPSRTTPASTETSRPAWPRP